MLQGVLMNLGIGPLDGLAHSVGKSLGGEVDVGAPGGDQVLPDEVGRHGAGELAGGRAAHAVRNNEERPTLTQPMLPHIRHQGGLAARKIGHEEGVLVVLPAPPHVRAGEYADTNFAAHRPSGDSAAHVGHRFTGMRLSSTTGSGVGGR